MRSEQRGVAIVLAMGVVALAAIAAAAIMVSQSTWARESELTAHHAQAQVLVQDGLNWARAILSDDRRTSSIDHLGEPWALRLAPIPIENGEIAGYLEDQQGAFNLNNLVQGGKVSLAQLARFRRLLTLLGLPLALADALADWLDADSEPQPKDGAEDSYYLTLATPYLAANQPLTDLGELALVRGFNGKARARLRPFVTALPKPTAINVNTASAEVLATLIEGLDLDGARALVAQRERVYFRDRADFLSRLPSGLTAPNDQFTVASDYFLATVRASIGDTEARGTALLERGETGWPAVVWRKYL